MKLKALSLSLLFSGALALTSFPAGAEEEHGHEKEHGDGITEALRDKEELRRKLRLEEESAIPLETVIAEINGEKLLQKEYMSYLLALLRQQSKVAPPSRKALLDEIVSRHVVLQDAVAKKLNESEEFQSKLKFLRDALLAEYAMQQALKETEISDEDLKAIYQEQAEKAQRPNEYKARHILVKSEEEAKELLAQLEKGADFAALAKEKSMDKGSGTKGGDLGWFLSRSMVPPFAEAVEAMKKGERSKAPVKSDFGWHIILLEDIRKVPLPEFESVKGRLLTEKKNRIMVDYVEGLRKKAKVEIYDIKPNKDK